jgi:hypothetical protein
MARLMMANKNIRVPQVIGNHTFCSKYILQIGKIAMACIKFIDLSTLKGYI